MAPTVVQAVCVGGVVTAPTLTMPSTIGITYTVAPAGPYRQGQTVTVTATLAAAGVGGRPMPAWLDAGVGHDGEFEVTFAAKSCTPVTPVVPAVTQATCTAGAGGAAEVAAGPTTGIVYVVAPASLGNGTQSGRGDGDGDGDGRVRVGDDQPRRGNVSMRRRRRGRRRWRRRRVREVTPVAPTVAQAVCVAGVVTPPTLTMPSTSTGSPTRWLRPAVCARVSR